MTGNYNRWERRGREAKVKRYAIRIDEDEAKFKANPFDPATAAGIVERLKAVTPEQWWALSKAMKEPSFPSPDTVREIINVYRVRAGLPSEEAPAPVERPVVERFTTRDTYRREDARRARAGLRMNCARTGCTNNSRDAGSMSGFDAHHATVAALHRAAEMTDEDSKSFLAVSLLRIALELRGWCSNCVLNAQGDVNGSITVGESPSLGGVLGKLLLMRRTK